ncbi:hypothetical protein CDAR_264361 [Caerostris darwini]|uniref:Uncharacterized protein n=1 Tax=Caerostris darwini TaxID=1538125 RepID=A0AAV4Q3P9_9ARAC|nr:hypothetical protein CDAR_264361 [Caerostris darwini]
MKRKRFGEAKMYGKSLRQSSFQNDPFTTPHPLPKTVALTICLNRTPLRSIDDDDDCNYASNDETKTISSHCRMKASPEELWALELSELL